MILPLALPGRSPTYQVKPIPTASVIEATILACEITWTWPFRLPPRGLQA
jgi:hypothetical protein